MAGESIDLGVKAISDFRKLLSDMTAFGSVMKTVTKDVQTMAMEMDNANKAFTANIRVMSAYQKNQQLLNKERTNSYSTTKQLINQETLIHSLYTKNSDLAEKKYLSSITGLRQGLQRFNEESKHTMVIQNGQVSLLSDNINKFKAFAIQANMVGRTMDNMSKQAINLGKNLQWTGRQMMVGLTAPIVAGGALAIKTYLSMQTAATRAMKLVGVLEAHPTKQAQQEWEHLDGTVKKLTVTYGENYEKLITLAGELKGVGFSVGDTEELTKLSNIFDKLSGTNDLTKTGDFVRILAQTQGGVKGAADALSYFNAVEGQTSIDVPELIQSFPKIANVFRLLNINIGQGTAMLSAFKENGVDVSEGATALTRTLARLGSSMAGANGSGMKQLREFIQDWNTKNSDKAISFFDKMGNIKVDNAGLQSVAKAFAGMTQEQQFNFASLLAGTRQYDKMLPLLNSLGIAYGFVDKNLAGNTVKTNDYIKAVSIYNDYLKDSSKYTKEFADQAKAYSQRPEVMWANLKNNLRLLAAEFGKELLPTAEHFMKVLTGLLERIEKMSPHTKKMVRDFLVLAAAVGPVVYAMGQMVLLLTQLARFSVINPIKWLTHLRLGKSNELIGDQGLVKKFIELQQEFRNTGDMNMYATGLNRLMAEQAALRASTDATTASLAEQGAVMGTTGRTTSGGYLSRILGTRKTPEQTLQDSINSPNMRIENWRNKMRRVTPDVFNAYYGPPRSKLKLVNQEIARVKAEGNIETPYLQHLQRVSDAADDRRNLKGRKISYQEQSDTQRFVRSEYNKEYDKEVRRRGKERANAKLNKFSELESKTMARDAEDLGANTQALAHSVGRRTAIEAQEKAFKRSNLKRGLVSANLFGDISGRGFSDAERAAREALYDADPNKYLKPTRREVDHQKRLTHRRNINEQRISAGMEPLAEPKFHASKWAHVKDTFSSAKVGLAGKLGKETEGVAKHIGTIGKEGAKGLFKASAWATPGKFLNVAGKGIKDLSVGLKDAGKSALPIMDLFTGGAASAFAPVMGTVVAAIAPFVAILAVVGAAVFLIWKNWDKVSKGIGTGISELKSAFKGVVNAIIGPFKDMFKRLQGSGEGLSSTWKGIGQIIGLVAKVIAFALKAITPLIKAISSQIADILYILIKIGQFVVDVFTGQWKQALNAILAIVGTFAGMLARAFTVPLSMLLKGIEKIVNLGAKLHIPWAKAIKGDLNDAEQFLDELPNKIADAIRPDSGKAKDNMKKAGEDAGSSFADAMKQRLKDSIGKEIEQETEDIKKFMEAFKKRMEDVVSGWKDAALKAFDDQTKGQTDAIDAQIANIDKLKKAEEDELKTKEYIKRREDILNQKKLSQATFVIERDKAVYEGKYDDALQLQQQQVVDQNKLNQDLQDNEDAHTKDLRDAQRDADKTLLEDKKKALEDQRKLQRDALQKQLDLITEYLPKNVAEANNMQRQILGVLDANNRASLQKSAEWSKGWSEAFQKAGKDVAEDAAWAGQQVFDAFAGALGLDPTALKDELNILDRPEKDIKGGNALNIGGGSAVFHSGGSIGGSQDDIPIIAQSGEFVISRQGVNAYGKNALHKINKGMPIFHSGGEVSAVNQLIKGGMTGAGHLYAKLLGPVLKAGGMAGITTGMPTLGPVGPMTDIKNYVKNAMSAFGWGEDQWPFLEKLVNNESGWNPNAKNPTSTAAGLFQFLDSTWKSYIQNAGGPPYWSNDIGWQTRGGLQYVKSRYQTPQHALETWYSHKPHWYHSGGLVQLKNGGKTLNDGPAMLHKGESVLKSDLSNRWESALAKIESGEHGVNIYVDNFIGQPEWFKKMMSDYNIKIAPKKDRQFGRENRVVSSYADTKKGYR